MADRGISLLELLVVLVILCVAAALVAPNFSGFLELYSVRKAARQLVTDLQFARMRAVSEGVDHRVTFVAPDEPRYTVEREEGGGTWATVDIVRDFSDPKNPYYARRVLMSTRGDPLRIAFSPLGSASPAASIILHTPSGQSKTVRVTLTGRIRLEQ